MSDLVWLDENTLELREWRACEIPGRMLTPRDARLARELARGNRLTIDELRHGLRVRAQQWVGVVRLEGGLEIRVVPKLAGDSLRLLELIEFTRGLASLAEYSGVRELHDGGGSLLDLIGLLFVRECERIARGGLRADYVEHEDELPVLRGRLLIREQLQRRLGRPERLWCRYDERSTDIFDNQLLAAGVEACLRYAGDPAVRKTAVILRDLLGEACDLQALDVQAAVGPELAYDRLNVHYRQAHSLAKLLLTKTGLDDLFAHGATSSFVFLLNMDRLFEDFVERLVAGVVKELPARVRPQLRDSSIIRNAATQKRYATIIPDLLIEHGGGQKRLAIDAKYKLYESTKVAVSDITQAFLYAFAYGGDVDETPPTSLLFFPSSTAAFSSTELEIKSSAGLSGARITAVSLPIPRLLDELKQESAGVTMTQLRSLICSAAGLANMAEAA